MNLLDGRRDGVTFTEADLARLNKQARRVFLAMVDQDWHTLRDVADRTGDPEASVSARLRDFRKPRFGGMSIDRKRGDNGLHAYRIADFGTLGND